MKKFKGKIEDLIGKRYGDLPTDVKEKVLYQYYTGTYYGTILGFDVKEPTKIGRYKCTLNFEDNISIPATLVVTENDKVYEIDDDAIFYCTTD